MKRTIISDLATAVLLLGMAFILAACGSADGKTKEQPVAPAAVAVSPVAVSEQPISRYIRVTGSLTPEEQADVAAETPGRVTGSPIERGSRVEKGTVLIRLSSVETEASLREAEANAAQIAARLALDSDGRFDLNKVPEVANAKANVSLAEAEFGRIETLLAQRVVSQSEYDQRKTNVEAARQQLESAKNSAQQQYQGLLGARARVSLAQKALADTVVRAPFTGVVVQRMVSTGDYVTKGMKVAEVVRITPLRVQLTVPEQFVKEVRVGQPVTLSVDAYPGRTFEGRVRYVSPSLRVDQRALTVEAVVPNDNAELKPGMFATAQILQASRTPAVLAPKAAVQTIGGTSRVFVVNGDHVEERIVTTGQQVGDLIEITNGLKGKEPVATANVSQLVDGMKAR
jgi:RND family efflux transporter MFP subunit